MRRFCCNNVRPSRVTSEWQARIPKCTNPAKYITQAWSNYNSKRTTSPTQSLTPTRISTALQWTLPSQHLTRFGKKSKTLKCTWTRTKTLSLCCPWSASPTHVNCSQCGCLLAPFNDEIYFMKTMMIKRWWFFRYFCKNLINIKISPHLFHK